MKSIYILFLFLISLGMVACKQDAANQTVETAPETAQETPSTSAGGENGGQAGQTSTGGHDFTFLTDKILHYKAAFGGGSTGQEPPYNKEWIDLEPSGKYKAGKLKEQTHTGKWTYNHDTKLLFLQPDKSEFKMSEWKVMYNNQMLVWIGTQTYGNQSTQIQLVRSDDLPQ